MEKWAQVLFKGLNPLWKTKAERGGQGAGSRRPHLVAVHGNGCQRQDRDVQGAVLGEAADVAHAFPEHPRAVHEADLETRPQRSGDR